MARPGEHELRVWLRETVAPSPAKAQRYEEAYAGQLMARCEGLVDAAASSPFLELLKTMPEQHFSSLLTNCQVKSGHVHNFKNAKQALCPLTDNNSEAGGGGGGPRAPAGLLWFYEKDDPYYEFTNFWPNRGRDPQTGRIQLASDSFVLAIDGQLWPTTEHFFQAAKYSNPQAPRCDLVDQIRLLGTPREAFDYARREDLKQYVDNRWWHGSKDGSVVAYKDKAMLLAVRAKFFQNPSLADLLLSTGELLLVEHTGNDPDWGDGGGEPPFYDGRNWGPGKNKLGEILMKIRDELRVDRGMQPVMTAPAPAPSPSLMDSNKDQLGDALRRISELEMQLDEARKAAPGESKNQGGVQLTVTTLSAVSLAMLAHTPAGAIKPAAQVITEHTSCSLDGGSTWKPLIDQPELFGAELPVWYAEVDEPCKMSELPRMFAAGTITMETPIVFGDNVEVTYGLGLAQLLHTKFGDAGSLMSAGPEVQPEPEPEPQAAAPVAVAAAVPVVATTGLSLELMFEQPEPEPAPAAVGFGGFGAGLVLELESPAGPPSPAVVGVQQDAHRSSVTWATPRSLVETCDTPRTLPDENEGGGTAAVLFASSEGGGSAGGEEEDASRASATPRQRAVVQPQKWVEVETAAAQAVVATADEAAGAAVEFKQPGGSPNSGGGGDEDLPRRRKRLNTGTDGAFLRRHNSGGNASDDVSDDVIDDVDGSNAAVDPAVAADTAATATAPAVAVAAAVATASVEGAGAESAGGAEAVRQWLAQEGMGAYADPIIEQGYDDLEVFDDATIFDDAQIAELLAELQGHSEQDDAPKLRDAILRRQNRQAAA